RTPSASVTTAARRSRSSDSTRFRTRVTASTASNARKMRRSSNAPLFWPVMLFVTASDFVTKKLAVERLVASAMPHPVFGGWFRLALVRTRGGAFGLNVGEFSRYIFMGLTIVALVILARLFPCPGPDDISG